MKVKKRLFLPSIADILFLSIFLFLTLSAGQGLLADGDTGYHVRAGEYVLDTLSVPKYDMFSYISPPLPWTAHEWLSEVVMAVIHRLAGLTGVVIFFAALIAFSYLLFFHLLKSYRGNFLVTVLVTVLVIASSQIHWLARPHIFSLLLTMIWYFLLDDYQYRNRNRLYVLPFLMLLWVNLHGGFITGLMLTGIYLAGNLFYSFFGPVQEKPVYKGRLRTLGLVFAACIIAALINPYGYHILLFPFVLTSNKILMNNIQEFLSPNFHEHLVFTYLLFLLVAVLAVSKRVLNVIELVLVLLFTYMALYSVRYIPLFAIIVAPPLVRMIDSLIRQSGGRLSAFLVKRADRISSVDESARGFFWPAASVVLVVLLAAGGTLGYTFDEKIKPVAAVEFLKKEHLSGHMFNNDEFGDYIIYSAHRQYRVFMDGRSDMYGPQRLKEYSRVTGIKPSWEKVLDKYHVNWIIYDANSPLCMFLMENNGWKLIYADKVADIFVKNVPENRRLIEKYRNVKMVFDNKKASL